MIFQDDRTREHFGKLLRMLASDQSGERAVAALKATQLLLSHGLDWHVVASALEAPSAPARRAHRRPASAATTNMPHNIRATSCLRSGVAWKPHETEFLKQMQTLGRAPSEKQRAWLDHLVTRSMSEGQEAA